MNYVYCFTRLQYASHPIRKNTYYILYYDIPSTIVSNPHLAGLASLHRGGGGGGFIR
jgi:hypothetical protein